MKKLFLLLLVAPCAVISQAQGVTDLGTYYQAADGQQGEALKTALFQIIKTHEVQSYTPGVWNAINAYDVRPDGTIWDIYSCISHFTPIVDQDKGVDTDQEGYKYNREHAMPKSWFNEDKNDTSYPMYTDLHHLFPTDRLVNTMRSNYPYGEVGTTITKQSAEGFSKLGIAVDSIGYKPTDGSKPRVFEPADEYKGDLARAYFYMATAYESYKNGFGSDRSQKNWSSPMLESNAYPFFTLWALKMLLRWAAQDPVSEKEVNRNAAIFDIQKNRNPFIDYPGLEQYIWGALKDVPFSYDHYTVPSTGISSPVSRPSSLADHHYNLQGQRLSRHHLRRGIYIHQGRKVVVR